MAGMNINKMRNQVLQGQIATIEAQIRAWEVYSDRTDEDVTTIIAELSSHIERCESMII